MIELLLVVAIAAIIAAISVPIYNSNVKKAGRDEAKTALTELANRQELHLAQYDVYSTVVNNTPGLGYGSIYSKPNEYYALTVSACSGGALTNCYVITATASNIKNARQFNDDTDCRTLSLSNNGTQSATNSTGAITTDICW